MNKEMLEGQWLQIKGILKEKFGNLTDDDLRVINGRYDELIGALERRYGFTKEQATVELNKFLVARFPGLFKAETSLPEESFRVKEETATSPFMKFLAYVGVPLLIILGFLGYENGKMHDQTVTKPVNVSQDMIKSDNPADVALVSGIRSALANDELVASDLPNIQIKASNGVVTLSGIVPATLDRDEIVQVVQHSNGVKQINNLIEVRTS